MTVSNYQKIIVVGAGIPGLTLAVALKRKLGRAIDVHVYDAQYGMPRSSGRASAIAAGPRRFLQTLEIWPSIANCAQPIQSMIVTDSKLGDAIRPHYLQFAQGAVTDEPFAHMVEDDALSGALKTAANALGVNFVASNIDRANVAKGKLIINPSSGPTETAQLLVAADGGKSRLRAQMGIPTSGRVYGQFGLVATFSHQNPHEGRAEEHFLPQGPFAVLPLVNNRISIVWTLPRAEASQAVALPEAELIAQVQSIIGFSLGDLQLMGRPKMFPLSLQIARSLVAERLALIGDAAHVIHPLAGQGLNLGLRDAEALAQAICRQIGLGLDAGASDMLAGYQRQRRFDTLAMAATTDGLNRLFANDMPPLRMIRRIGLGLVDRLPGLKQFFIRQAEGSAPQ